MSEKTVAKFLGSIFVCVGFVGWGLGHLEVVNQKKQIESEITKKQDEIRDKWAQRGFDKLDDVLYQYSDDREKCKSDSDFGCGIVYVVSPKYCPNLFGEMEFFKDDQLVETVTRNTYFFGADRNTRIEFPASKDSNRVNIKNLRCL